MRLIDADELERVFVGKHYGVNVIKYFIKMQPTIDAMPVKHGRWIYYEGETIEDGGRCSVCECDQPMFIDDWEWKYIETDYCPNCGALMDEVEE